MVYCDSCPGQLLNRCLCLFNSPSLILLSSSPRSIPDHLEDPWVSSCRPTPSLVAKPKFHYESLRPTLLKMQRCQCCFHHHHHHHHHHDIVHWSCMLHPNTHSIHQQCILPLQDHLLFVVNSCHWVGFNAHIGHGFVNKCVAMLMLV